MIVNKQFLAQYLAEKTNKEATTALDGDGQDDGIATTAVVSPTQSCGKLTQRSEDIYAGVDSSTNHDYTTHLHAEILPDGSFAMDRFPVIRKLAQPIQHPPHADRITDTKLHAMFPEFGLKRIKTILKDAKVEPTDEQKTLIRDRIERIYPFKQAYAAMVVARRKANEEAAKLHKKRRKK